MAKVVSVNLSEKKGVMKKPITEGKFLEDFGLENDAHAGKWHRQVSLLAQESINKMIEKSKGELDLKPGMFAENITTEGIELHTLPIGTKLSIGEVEAEVTQIGKKCHDMCEIKRKVGECVMPKEGIFIRILKEGIIREGDEVKVI